MGQLSVLLELVCRRLKAVMMVMLVDRGAIQSAPDLVAPASRRHSDGAVEAEVTRRGADRNAKDAGDSGPPLRHRVPDRDIGKAQRQGHELGSARPERHLAEAAQHAGRLAGFLGEGNVPGTKSKSRTQTSAR